MELGASSAGRISACPSSAILSQSLAFETGASDDHGLSVGRWGEIRSFSASCSSRNASRTYHERDAGTTCLLRPVMRLRFSTSERPMRGNVERCDLRRCGPCSLPRQSRGNRSNETTAPNILLKLWRWKGLFPVTFPMIDFWYQCEKAQGAASFNVDCVYCPRQ